MERGFDIADTQGRDCSWEAQDAYFKSIGGSGKVMANDDYQPEPEHFPWFASRGFGAMATVVVFAAIISFLF